MLSRLVRSTRSFSTAPLVYHVAPVQGYEQSHDASNNLKNLALLVGRAAGGKDPAAYYRSLLQAKSMNRKDAAAADLLIYHLGNHKGEGKKGGRVLPLSNFLDAKEVDKCLEDLKPVFSNPQFGGELKNFSSSSDKAEDEEFVNRDSFVYYKAFIIGLPMIALLGAVSFTGEFFHINHMKHEQHARISGEKHH